MVLPPYRGVGFSLDDLANRPPAEAYGHEKRAAQRPGVRSARRSRSPPESRVSRNHGHSLAGQCLILPGEEGCSGPPQSSAPSNIEVTEPSSKTSEMALAMIGAMDRTVSLSKRRSSDSGSVSVTMTLLTREFFSRSTAGPE